MTLNAGRFVSHVPRFLINTFINPGTLFDGFNANLEWSHENGGFNWVNAANITSTVICTGLRGYAEIKKTPDDANNDNVNPVLRIARNTTFSTAAAGITQLIVAGTNTITNLKTGNFNSVWLPLNFGVGDIVVASNKEAQAEEIQTANANKPVTTTGTVIAVLTTGENYFAYGLSTGQGMKAATVFGGGATALFVSAAVFATARNVPFLSRQLNRLGWFGEQMGKPSTTFGLLSMGCVVAACNNNIHVAVSYLGFGLAYHIIPTFKKGGLYEAVRGHFRTRTVPATSQPSD